MKFGNSRIKANPKVPRVKPKGTFESNKGLITQNFELLFPIFQKSITGLTRESMMTYVKTIVDTHNRFIKNLGVKFGTSHYKKICNYSILLCEGRPAEPVSRVSTGRTDKWPNCFGQLRPIFKTIINDNETKDTRAANMQLLQTLFKLNKVCESFMELNIEDIQMTFEIDKDFERGFIAYLEERLKHDNAEENLSRLRAYPVYGSAKGPNGLPKMQTANLEAKSLLEGSLAEPFTRFCELTQNEGLLNYARYYASITNEDDKKTKAKLRKLVAIPDSGNKSRVVAICDFWTQCLLAPLEDAEEAQLKKNFSGHSAFYSHSRGFDFVKSSCDDSWKSIDATAWTDNFPSRLQYLYLKQRYGKALAHAWRELAVDCQWFLGNSDLTIKYGKGQGMGTKGSFMIASVVDHYVIEYVLQQHYKKVMPYCKVGDDLVVSDKDNILAKFYPSIGVPVNLTKSKELTPKGLFVEFVSRNLWDGLDISPISAKLVYKSYKQHFLLPTLLLHLKERIAGPVLPSLNDLLQCMKMSKDELNKLYKIVDVYQRLSGEELCFIPEDVPVLSDEQFLRIVGHILLDCGVKLSQRDNHNISEEVQEENETMFNDQSVLELDDFSLATRSRLTLAKLKTYIFFRKIYLRACDLDEGRYEIHDVPTLWRFPAEDSNLEISTEFKELVLDIIFETQEELNRLKIIKSLSLEKWRDSKIIIALFSFLNKYVKLSETNISIGKGTILTSLFKRSLGQIIEKSMVDTKTQRLPNSSP